MATMLLPPNPPSSDRERLAHLADDLVLKHRIAEHLSFVTFEALHAIARQDPGIDQGAARLLVQQALTAIVEVEILASRRAA
jgi:hypothetical protein